MNVIKRPKEPESLSTAVAGATGVSGGSAHAIPVLLMPDRIGGRNLTDMTELEFLDDATFDSADCCRIRGMYAEHPKTVWIDKATGLIRRIDLEMPFDGYRVETTTTFDPVVNSEIPTTAFAFDPPSDR